MRIEQLALRDFRNIEQLDLELDNDLVVFHGDNGQGKTNLLEAIYYLANLKSFRRARRGELIRFGCERSQVKARVLSGSWTRRCEAVLDRQGRSVRVDGAEQRSLTAYFDGIRAVAFTPEDPATVRGSPGGRRAFLDRGAFLLRPQHLDLVRELGRVVMQKNALLRKSNEELGGDQLRIWNERLADVGAQVSQRRAEFIEELRGHLADVHTGLTGSTQTLDIEYRAGCQPGDREALAELLASKESQEWQRRQSLVGPHREDLTLHLGGRDLRTYGSQGQVRSAALALKLALLSAVSGAAGDPPLFVLDDLGSELDPSRNQRLLERLRDEGGQVFVATTSLHHVPLPDGSFTAHRVHQGTVDAAP